MLKCIYWLFSYCGSINQTHNMKITNKCTSTFMKYYVYCACQNINISPTRWLKLTTLLHQSLLRTDQAILTPKSLIIIHVNLYLYFLHNFIRGPGSSVGIATDNGLDGPGSNPGGDEIFRPSRPALGPTQPPVKWGTGSFPGVKCGRGVLPTTHPLLVPRSWKSRAIPLPTLWATPGL